mgnify:CR=1 FL=1
MFSHARLFVVLLTLLLVPALGCRSTRPKEPVYEHEPVESTSSGCSHCG